MATQLAPRPAQSDDTRPQTDAKVFATIRRRVSKLPHVRDRVNSLLDALSVPLPGFVSLEVRYIEDAGDESSTERDAMNVKIVGEMRDRSHGYTAAYEIGLWIPFELGEPERVFFDTARDSDNCVVDGVSPEHMLHAWGFAQEVQRRVVAMALWLHLFPGNLIVTDAVAESTPLAGTSGIELVGAAPALDLGRPAPDCLCGERINDTMRTVRGVIGGLQRAQRFAEFALPLLIEDQTAADMEYDAENAAVTCYVRGTVQGDSGPVTVTVSRSFWANGNDRSAYIDVLWPQRGAAYNTNPGGEFDPSEVPAYTEALVIATERGKRTGLLD